MIAGFQIIEKQVREKIVDELDNIGLLYRLFSRAKDEKSLNEKVQRKADEGNPYSLNGKKIQDVIGVRIVTYFKDDIEIVKNVLGAKLDFVDEEIDELALTVFKPKRTNIICSLNSEEIKTLDEIKSTSSYNNNYKLVDNTFELQLRTILSEGWHEIDHSLRYKCKDDWEGHKESERLLNGIYASLETNDIALKNLFNELSYKHFKSKNWEALIRNKFRLKFQQGILKKELVSILDKDPLIAKKIVKLDRTETLLKIAKLDFIPPINLNNLLMLINCVEIKNQEILEITPDPIKKAHNTR